MKKYFFALFFLFNFSPAGAQIYADFAVSQGGTSLGTFRAELSYDKAPRTVANFIGLAEGTRAWVNPTTGGVSKNPFYAGLKFHRLIHNFMIQGGDPLGTGGSGPGYRFEDEFDPTLRHDSAYTLSMANSGPNTNGSQFFITFGATAWLDDVHTVFGKVISGQSIIDGFTNSTNFPTNASNAPLTDIVLDSITIVRVGAAALAFDENAQGLPLCGGADPEMIAAQDSSNFELSFTRSQGSDYKLFYGTDLNTWQNRSIGFYSTSPPPTTNYSVNDIALGQPRAFFRVSETVYPASVWAPDATTGILTLNIATVNGSAASDVIVLNFGASTYDINSATFAGSIVSADLTPEGPSARLSMSYDAVIPMLFNLGFDAEVGNTKTGRLTGFYYSGGTSYPITGTFSWTL